MAASGDRPNRSAVDYDNETLLYRALLEGAPPSVAVETKPLANSADLLESDWVLNTFDPLTTETQSMEEEFKRLQVLKSYLILDADREEVFERITRIASRTFNVPISLISLVDLGRQFFVASHGVPSEVTETPRKHAFCAHAILTKGPKANYDSTELRGRACNSILVVPDAALDFRFQNNPLVVGPPYIRFYAGAPLMSPEGYKLGTLCIIDTQPHPDGLSTEDRHTLLDLTAMAMQSLVERKGRIESEKSNPAETIACTAHDLMTQLTGIQLSLSLLKDDDEIKNLLGNHRMDLLLTAASCSDVMQRICHTLLGGLRSQKGSELLCGSDILSLHYQSSGPVTNMQALVQSLRDIMDPIRKKVPLIISLDEKVPPFVIADDLKIFRSALNLLENAANRTSNGSIHLKIAPQHRDAGSPCLLFECEDSGKNIDVDEYFHLFDPIVGMHNDDDNIRNFGLSSVASLISSIKGKYGFRPKGENKDGQIVLNTKGEQSVGAIFWFSIPLSVPESTVNSNCGRVSPCDSESTSNNDTTHSKCIETSGDKNPKRNVTLMDFKNNYFFTNRTDPATQHDFEKGRSLSRRNLSYGNVKERRLLEVDNALQACAISDSCLSAFYLPNVRSCGLPSSLSLSQGGRNSYDPHNSEWLPKRVTNDNTYSSHIDDMQISPCTMAKLEQTLVQKENILLNLLHSSKTELNNSLSSISNGKVNFSNSPERKVASGQCDSNESSIAPRKRVRRALIIEDSLVIRKGLARTLNKLGFVDVTMAVDGMEGLTELKKQLYDIVLCDFLMPVMDGMDCVKQYRVWEEENRPYFQQYIVGISAHATANDGNQGLEAGMNDFRPKPISINTLMDIKDTDMFLRTAKTLNELFDEECTSQGSVVECEMEELDFTDFIATETSVQAARKLHAKSMQNMDQELHAKRQRQQPVCLIATDNVVLYLNETIASLEKLGWVVALVHEGMDALRLLQQRNWNIVLIDDDLSLVLDDSNGNDVSCVDTFREWEKIHRVNRQKNIYLMCEADIPSPFDNSSSIQPPCGYNGVLRKPLPWKDLIYVMERDCCVNGPMEIVVRN